MMKIVHRFLLVILTLIGFTSIAQEPQQVYKWNVSSKRIAANQYEIIFQTEGKQGWQLYAPQTLGDAPTVALSFSDSAIVLQGAMKDSGTAKQSPLFEGEKVNVYEGSVVLKQLVSIKGKIPQKILGSLSYSYGNDAEYLQEPFSFSVALEGGEAAGTRIKIASIDLKNPVNNCGDDDADDKSLLTIFLLGFTGGLIALITPCVFPLIPLTVSFFTKRSGTRKKGIANALLYGFSIFAIYVLLSLPFHLVDKANPEILNNISTNMWVNLVFFVIFIFFALSFFGLYELTLPSSFANRVDSKSGISDVWGIFFMALTLAIVSFSCTGPILGSLLAGVSSGGGTGGATQLSFGMAGFGVGLGLPFALFAMFPGWLQSLPKSGGWLTSVKVVLGFLELALAVKFLSNADLVEQWGLLKREVFIGIWILISLCIVLYLLGVFNKKANKPKLTTTRWGFIIFFSAVTLYLIPGLTTTKWSNLKLISGFPPPLSYSLYDRKINIKPIHNDYEKAVQLAKEQNKPILIDFTGWACVNCRRMEENVWIDKEVEALMKNNFIVVSLYVDERNNLPLSEQMEYTTKNGTKKSIISVGDKWATFQSENFNSVSQPQYAILSPDEKALTKTKGYTPDPAEFIEWLQCGLDAFGKVQKK
jgi:thiol:disulfide interchange protein